MTPSRTFLTAVLLLAAAPACASRARVRSQQGEIDQLKAQLGSLQKDQREARAQNDSLRNEMFILHDRVETARTMLARTQQAPPKLEVVKLSPQVSNDPLAARVTSVSSAPRVKVVDPVDTEGYDPSADEAEMFSTTDDNTVVTVSPIPEMGASAAAPLKSVKGPFAKPVTIAAAAPQTPAEAIPASLAKTRTSGPKEDPMKLYQRAFESYQGRKYEESQLLFQQFVNENPSHEYADNAYYWMGEIYYTQGEYGLAVDEFQKVPELYPGGNKVPDALFKLGLSYLGLKNSKNAEKTLKQLIDAYPQSSAAQLGRQKLASIPEKQ